MIYQMSTHHLNFYSKYSLAKEKKPIASLYDLIPESKDNLKSRSDLHHKLTICKTSKKGDKNNQEENYNNDELMESLSQFKWLHESQKRQLLESTMKEQLRRQTSLTESQMSKRSHHFKRQTSYLYTHKPINNQQAQSAKQKPQQQNLQINNAQPINSQEAPKLVALSEIALHESIDSKHSSSHCINSEVNEQVEQANDMLIPLVPSQPLQAEVEQMVVQSQRQSSLNKNPELQIPDKIISNISEYDQQDFKDAFGSSIRQNSIAGMHSSRYTQRKTPREHRIQQLKNILIDFHQQQQPKQIPHSQLPIQSEVTIVHASNQEIDKKIQGVSGEQAVVVEVKAKKKNFKAMMAKKNEQGKSEKNKKLLLNFFDQN